MGRRSRFYIVLPGDFCPPSCCQFKVAPMKEVFSFQAHAARLRRAASSRGKSPSCCGLPQSSAFCSGAHPTPCFPLLSLSSSQQQVGSCGENTIHVPRFLLPLSRRFLGSSQAVPPVVHTAQMTNHGLLLRLWESLPVKHREAHVFMLFVEGSAARLPQTGWHSRGSSQRRLSSGKLDPFPIGVSPAVRALSSSCGHVAPVQIFPHPIFCCLIFLK